MVGGRRSAVGAEHGSSPDGNGLSPHPAARRTYALRGRIRHRTCAFSAELLYRHDQGQITIHAAITTSTPHALAALIRLCEDLPPALAAALSD